VLPNNCIIVENANLRLLVKINQNVKAKRCNEVFQKPFVFMLQDMFTVESKQEPRELSVSISCLDDLQLGDIITSNGCAAFFAAKIRQHQPGILCTEVIVLFCADFSIAVYETVQ